MRTAENGTDALRKLADQEPPDVIVTDLNMPSMGGLEFTRAVRNDSRFRFTPIFLLTNETDRRHRDELKSAGATGWLVKPVNGADLLGVLKRAAPV